MKVREGEFEIDFPPAVGVERLDVQGLPLPHGMRLVDFTVEEKHRCLLLEIKDPSINTASPANRQQFASTMLTNVLINENLTPKARDSYSYLHLMKKDQKPFVYIVLMGVEAFPNDKALLVGFKDRLLARLRKETKDEWARRYVSDCVVLTPRSWRTAFPDYPLSRIVSTTSEQRGQT